MEWGIARIREPARERERERERDSVSGCFRNNAVCVDRSDRIRFRSPQPRRGHYTDTTQPAAELGWNGERGGAESIGRTDGGKRRENWERCRYLAYICNGRRARDHQPGRGEEGGGGMYVQSRVSSCMRTCIIHMFVCMWWIHRDRPLRGRSAGSVWL